MPTVKQQLFGIFFPPLQVSGNELLARIGGVRRGNRNFLWNSIDTLTEILSYRYFPASWLYAIDFRSPDEFVSVDTTDEVRFVLKHEHGASLLSLKREGLNSWLLLQVFPHTKPDKLVIRNQRVAELPYYPRRKIDYLKMPVKYLPATGMSFSPAVVFCTKGRFPEDSRGKSLELQWLAEYATYVLMKYDTFSKSEYSGYGKIPDAVIMGYVSYGYRFLGHGTAIIERDAALVHYHVPQMVPLWPRPTSEYSAPACALLRDVQVFVSGFGRIENDGLLFARDVYFADPPDSLSVKNLPEFATRLINQKA